MKILSVGAQLYRTDGQTDTTKLMVASLNFAKSLKSELDEIYQFQLKFTTTFSVFPQNLAITDCRKKFFDGPGPQGRTLC